MLSINNTFVLAVKWWNTWYFLCIQEKLKDRSVCFRTSKGSINFFDIRE